ncbi:hypothetical protein MTO96_036484 [Rhipicephalus appendiculatus]
MVHIEFFRGTLVAGSFGRDRRRADRRRLLDFSGGDVVVGGERDQRNEAYLAMPGVRRPDSKQVYRKAVSEGLLFLPNGRGIPLHKAQKRKKESSKKKKETRRPSLPITVSWIPDAAACVAGCFRSGAGEVSGTIPRLARR